MMPKEKKKAERKKKAGKKASQLAIRIEKSERDAFVELCDRLDTTAAREIRRFMREFVAAHADTVPAAEAATDEGAASEAAPPAEESAAPAKKPRAPRKPRAAAEPEAPAVEQPAPSRTRRRKAATAEPAV